MKCRKHKSQTCSQKCVHRTKKEIMSTKQKKLLDALNFIDQFACIASEDNNNNEAEQVAKNYNLLFRHICKTS